MLGVTPILNSATDIVHLEKPGDDRVKTGLSSDNEATGDDKGTESGVNEVSTNKADESDKALLSSPPPSDIKSGYMSWFWSRGTVSDKGMGDSNQVEKEFTSHVDSADKTIASIPIALEASILAENDAKIDNEGMELNKEINVGNDVINSNEVATFETVATVIDDKGVIAGKKDSGVNTLIGESKDESIKVDENDANDNMKDDINKDVIKSDGTKSDDGQNIVPNVAPEISDKNDSTHDVVPTRGWGDYIPFQYRKASTLGEPSPDNATTFATSSWFSWGKSQPVEEEDDQHSRKQELKDAKHKIQSSVDAINYAYHFDNSKIELSVSDTSTESLPIELLGKRYPLTPNELLEKPLLKTDIQDESTTLPNFEMNFRQITMKTQIRLLLESYVLKKPPTHLYKLKPEQIVANKRDIENVLIVAVHNFIPIKVVRSVTGPSGNGLTLQEEATKAVMSWFNKDVNIESIVLEGEGTINDRVENSLKLLENWHESFEKADFVYFVSHSLGVPIAINIMAEVVEKYGDKFWGFLSLGGMMEGIHESHEPKLKGNNEIEVNILQDIVDLARPEKEVSVKIMQSLVILIKYNVKITFVGNVDDYLVPLTSSLCNQFHHPNMFRALYTKENNFRSKLFEIALIMKNLGIYDDRNLLRDLNHEGTEGVEIIYQDVYLIGIKHCLETTNIHGHYSMDIDYDFTSASLYVLPWNFRGLLQDLLKLKNIESLKLIAQLQYELKRWEPESKHWKDVKYAFDAFDELKLDEFL